MGIAISIVIAFVIGSVVGIFAWVKYGDRATKTVEDIKNDIHKS